MSPDTRAVFLMGLSNHSLIMNRMRGGNSSLRVQVGGTEPKHSAVMTMPPFSSA